jgi:hypothetical protein
MIFRKKIFFRKIFEQVGALTFCQRGISSKDKHLTDGQENEGWSWTG